MHLGSTLTLASDITGQRHRDHPDQGGPGDDGQQAVAQLPAGDAPEERVRARHARPLLRGPEGASLLSLQVLEGP